MPKAWYPAAKGVPGLLIAAAVLGVMTTQELASSESVTRAFADRFSIAAMALMLLALTASYVQFLQDFVRYLLANLGQSFVIVLTMLMIWGLLGVGLGIPNLIWNENPLERFASAMGATLLMALLGVNAYYLYVMAIPTGGSEGRRVGTFALISLPFQAPRPWWIAPTSHLYRMASSPGPGPGTDMDGLRPDQVNRRNLSRFLRQSLPPFLILISLPAMFPRAFPYVPWNVRGELAWPLGPIDGNVREGFANHAAGLAVWLTGVLVGILLVWLLLRVSAVMNDAWHWLVTPDDRPPAVRRLSGLFDRTRPSPLGGFQQYLATVFVVYVVLALNSSESPWPRIAAGVLSLLAGTPPLIVALKRLGAGPSIDVLASLMVALLTLSCGLLMIISSPPVSPAFAIFALLGLLATAHVVFVRWDPRPVYALFALILAAILPAVQVRVWDGETISPSDLLAMTTLYATVAFGLLHRYGSRSEPPRESWAHVATSLLCLVAGIGLVGFANLPESLEGPAVVLAVLFWLSGCVAVALDDNPASARGGFQTPRRILLTLALGIWILLVNYDPLKERFDGLDYRNLSATEKVSRTIDKAYPYDILDLARVPVGSGLLKNREVLGNWEARLKRGGGPAGEPGPKPKLVLLCVSGGAIRSAYWAATVLDRLGSHRGLEDFHDHVRLITGASGGMVAMAYYEAVLHRNGPNPGPIRFRPEALIPPKSLDKVASFIALQAPWRMLLPRLPGAAADDRGLVLERDWEALRNVRFATIRELERNGEIPSLIFSPMIVDDGRRLLISNLDLISHDDLHREVGEETADWEERVLGEWPIPVARQDDLDNDNDGSLRNSFSISALELFKLVPDAAATLSLATAARMSATFPFVSPAVNLPTTPPLRVVDAGYYDNYGVHLASAWLLQNREWIAAHTSGVLILQIRDAVSKRDRVGVPSEERGFMDRLFQGAGLFGSVTDAILRARYSTTTFRNDQESIAVNEVFRKMGTAPSFVATAVFENSAYLGTGPADVGSDDERAMKRWPGLGDPSTAAGSSDVPMSWYLTGDERRAIRDAIPEPLSQGADLDARAYCLILRRHVDHPNFFRTDLDEARPGESMTAPLADALRYAIMLAQPGEEEREGRELLAYPERFEARVAELRDRFFRLGSILGEFSAPCGGAPSMQRLAEEAVDPSEDTNTVPEPLELLADSLKAGATEPERAKLLRELGLRIAASIDDPSTALDERQVLLFAHSEWINYQAGFLPVRLKDADLKPAAPSEPAPGKDADLKPAAPSEPAPGFERTYYTREFERVMNYHRLEAVRHWWKKNHSVPEPSPPEWPSGD